MDLDDIICNVVIYAMGIAFALIMFVLVGFGCVGLYRFAHDKPAFEVAPQAAISSSVDVG